MEKNTLNKAKIKALRIENSLSVKEVAQALEITEMSYYNKESGRTEFKVSEVPKLCDLFKVKAKDLFF